MKKTLLMLLFAMIALRTTAQTLDDCRRLAREHYPEIRQYDLISQTEQYNLSNAARAWLPQVIVSGQVTYQSATVNYPEILRGVAATSGMDNMTGIRKDQYKLAIDVSQNIWDGGQSVATKSMTKAEAAEQRSRIDVSLYDLQSRVDNLYFGILLFDERIAQMKAQIEILESNFSRMQAYYNNGVAMKSDVDAFEAELLLSRQVLGQIESSRASYRSMLELFIGQKLAVEKLERPVAIDVTIQASARPELALFKAQENRLVAQRKMINSSVMPRFSAFAQAYYGYPGLDMFKSMTSTEWTPNAIVGIRMLWNIGGFYTKKNDLKKLNIAQHQIAIQRDIFLFNTELQTTQDSREIARLRQVIAEDGRIVELRRSVRMAAESKLKNGVIDATDLLRKVAEETSATLSRSTHEIELLQAQYRLKTTLNQ